MLKVKRLEIQKNSTKRIINRRNLMEVINVTENRSGNQEWTTTILGTHDTTRRLNTET